MIFRSDVTHQKGFTVIEMLISTSVFAVVLLVCSAALLQISRTFYKGVTVTNTQEVARSVVDEIASAVEFSSTNPSGLLTNGATKGYCLGNTRISFRPGTMLGDPGVTHVLVADSPVTCSAPLDLTNTALPGAVNPRELVSPRMRVSNLVITSSSNRLYNITIRLVTGEDDLLSSPGGTNANCSGVLAGAQFCAAIELTTVVQKRIQ